MKTDDDSKQDDGTVEKDSTTIEKDEKAISEGQDKQSVDIDSMSEEDLKNLDMSNLDEAESKEAAEPEQKDQDQKESTDKAEEPGKPDDEAITHDPLKDTKAALTREQQRRADLEKENAELKRKMQEQKYSDFEELSSEELEDLKLDDPDAYIDYVLRSREMKQDKERFESDLVNDRQKKQYDQILNFAGSLGIDTKDENALNKFLSSDQFVSVDKYVTDNFKINSETGLYSSDQMQNAWKMLNFDEAVNDKTKNVREKVVDDITRAGNGGSKLDKITTTGAEAKGKAAKELSVDDIDSMSEAEAEKALKELSGEM